MKAKVIHNNCALRVCNKCCYIVSQNLKGNEQQSSGESKICADSHEHSLLANAISTKIACVGLHMDI